MTRGVGHDVSRQCPWLTLGCCICYTHTHPFNGPLSRTTRVSWHQKVKTDLDFTEARDSEWQWHQLGHMQVCTSLQTDNHASTPPLSFFTGRMPFMPPMALKRSIMCWCAVKKLLTHLPPNQQRQGSALLQILLICCLTTDGKQSSFWCVWT